MQEIFQSVNKVFSFIGPLSDFLWDFPTNFEWYAGIPLLGNFSFAIILLLGSGIYFSFRLGFVQVTHFKKGVKVMTERRQVTTGVSPLAAFSKSLTKSALLPSLRMVLLLKYSLSPARTVSARPSAVKSSSGKS